MTFYSMYIPGQHSKVALSFPINKFIKKNILRNKRTYIMINNRN